MIEDDPWGDDDGTFGGYALRDAEAVARLLLPLLVDGSGESSSWRAAMQSLAEQPGPDGYTSWSQVSELPGNGSWTPPHQYETASGRIPPQVRDRLIEELESDPGGHVLWRMRAHPVLSGHAVALQPPALGGTTESGSEIAVPRKREAASGQTTGSLRTLAGTWSRGPFPGWAWSTDGRLGVAAPPYADSLIVSGSRDVIERLAISGLEVFPVARSAPLPQVSD